MNILFAFNKIYFQHFPADSAIFWHVFQTIIIPLVMSKTSSSIILFYKGQFCCHKRSEAEMNIFFAFNKIYFQHFPADSAIFLARFLSRIFSSFLSE